MSHPLSDRVVELLRGGVTLGAIKAHQEEHDDFEFDDAYDDVRSHPDYGARGVLHYCTATPTCPGGRNDCGDWERVNCPACLKSRPSPVVRVIREMSTTEFRHSTRDVLNRVQYSGVHVTLVRHGRRGAVLVPVEDYDAAFGTPPKPGPSDDRVELTAEVTEMAEAYRRVRDHVASIDSDVDTAAVTLAEAVCDWLESVR